MCDVTATLADKLQAIQHRTHDQIVAREGVPVSIGGRVFEIKPLSRGDARTYATFQIGLTQLAQNMARGEFPDGDAFKAAQAVDRVQIVLLTLLLPELRGKRRWIDRQALDVEVAAALTVGAAFVSALLPGDPHPEGAGDQVIDETIAPARSEPDG